MKYILYENIEDIKHLSNDIEQIEFCSIIYEKAIEVRAEVKGESEDNSEILNLHLLIGKSNDDNLYRALCLDSGILYISNSSELNEGTINYLIKELCPLSIESFLISHKRGLKNFYTAGRLYKDAFWQIFNFFILKERTKDLDVLFHKGINITTIKWNNII